ncbi:MAG TPA: hypothetical protein VMI10_10125 [Terriglobales bacterium]|nr:hypothetical protein [Terriglobales bacterium]
MGVLWPWAVVAGLGAYHGIDPSMGWLFAVALGLQDQRRSRVLWSLVPITAGHLISIGFVVAIFTTLQSLVAIAWLQPAGAFALISFGTFRLFSRRGHPRWVAMRVNWIQLALWSFLMASAHGAGLMLFPILLGIVPPGGVCGDSIGRRGALMMHAHIQAIAVVLLHVGAMAVVMGAIAILVYEKIGLAILRSAWINLDAIWAAALIGAGVISLVV